MLSHLAACSYQAWLASKASDYRQQYDQFKSLRLDWWAQATYLYELGDKFVEISRLYSIRWALTLGLQTSSTRISRNINLVTRDSNRLLRCEWADYLATT